MTKKKVVIDAGHGGKDPGATSPAGHQEKENTLAIARQIRELEAGFGGHVEFYLTRAGDDNVSLEARAAYANQLRADYFISLHQNSDAKRQGRGIEVFALAPGGEAEKLGEIILRKLVQRTGLVNRGMKFANYAVLRETKMPAVLCEIGFIGTLEEARTISTASFHQQAALAICEGISVYLGVPFSPGQQASKTPTPVAVQEELHARVMQLENALRDIGKFISEKLAQANLKS